MNKTCITSWFFGATLWPLLFSVMKLVSSCWERFIRCCVRLHHRSVRVISEGVFWPFLCRFSYYFEHDDTFQTYWKYFCIKNMSRRHQYIGLKDLPHVPTDLFYSVVFSTRWQYTHVPALQRPLGLLKLSGWDGGRQRRLMTALTRTESWSDLSSFGFYYQNPIKHRGQENVPKVQQRHNNRASYTIMSHSQYIYGIIYHIY